MAINDMIMPGLKNPLLLMAEEIRKQISQKALEPPKTSPPIAGMPEDRDYTEGMERPELTTLKSEREFKATPAKTSAFLVALGNIFQDKQNLEAAKQQAQQSEYNAKLADAMEMNKLFKTGKMKREFDESDPDTQLRREAMQLEIAQKREMGPLELAAKKAEMEQRQEMYPLEKQYKQAALDRLLAKGTGGGGGRASGGAVSAEPNFANLSDEEVAQMTKWDASRMKVWKAANSKQKLLMLKPHMDEKTEMKLYGGGGRWVQKDGEMIYEKGPKDLSPRDLETAMKIINKRIGDIEYDNDVITPELQTELKNLEAQKQQVQNAMLKMITDKIAPTQGATPTAPTPSTKKSLKERAAELKAQNKTREETEAILMQEGY